MWARRVPLCHRPPWGASRRSPCLARPARILSTKPARKVRGATLPALAFLGAALATGSALTTVWQNFTATSDDRFREAALPAPELPCRQPAQVPNVGHSGSSDIIELLPPVMTSEGANTKLNEFAYSCLDGVASSVVRYDGAQLGSNQVCEDAYIHGRFPSPFQNKTDTTGKPDYWMAWGVFDGHNGWQTAHVLSRELLPYVQQALSQLEPADNGFINDEAIHKAIVSAFANLDDRLVKNAQDIIESDLSYPEKIKRLEPAYSGACALLTLYDPSSRKLHVASTGDCRAVLGCQAADGSWVARPLTKDQTGSNPDEVARLKAQFPDEPNMFHSRGRIYGMQPSRSLGDGVYKWNTELRERLRAEYNAWKEPGGAMYPGFSDGPYLTAVPVVSTLHLPLGDSPFFLIQATDGLWDTMGNQNAVDLVSRWSEVTTKGSNPESPSPLIDAGPVRFGRSRCWYSEARTTYQDSNVAVHLIRNGLGGAHEEMVCSALSFEPPLSRWIRDDTTVQVIFFGMS